MGQFITLKFFTLCFVVTPHSFRMKFYYHQGLTPTGGCVQVLFFTFVAYFCPLDNLWLDYLRDKYCTTATKYIFIGQAAIVLFVGQPVLNFCC